MNRIVYEVYGTLNLFCPVTGQRMLGEETFSQSPATRFVYVDDISEFEMIAPPFQEIWDEVSATETEADYEDGLCARFCERVAEQFPSVVIFDLTSHGMACGPASSRVIIGIDLAYNADDEDGDD